MDGPQAVQSMQDYWSQPSSQCEIQDATQHGEVARERTKSLHATQPRQTSPPVRLWHEEAGHNQTPDSII